jgi:ligand-binding SRPBCC domain-containing protein
LSGHQLRRRQVLASDMERVFAFFESPRNLEEITPPWLRFEVVAATDQTVRRGTLIDYRLTWQRLPMRWRTRITEYEPGVSFADEMIRGPYRRWYHRHLFRPVDGGVEMVDIVDFELPFGRLGRWTHDHVVRPQLESIFDYRRDVVSKRFGG